MPCAPRVLHRGTILILPKKSTGEGHFITKIYKRKKI